MSNKEFTHLHFHTEYSLLDASCKVKESMEDISRKGMRAVAMTDHGVLYGAISFYKAARAEGVKPLLGCEIYTTPDDMPMSERRTGSDGSQSNHLVLLAETYQGWQNLMKIVTKSHLEGFYYKPRADKELLRKHSEGLICLSACLNGEMAKLCARNELDQAIEKAGEFIDIFGKDNYFLELQNHGIDEQKTVNKGILHVASKTGLPLVATNDVHYMQRDHSEAHDCLICLQSQNVMSDPTRMRYPSDQFYIKTPEEMWKLWGEIPDALTNTMLITERCNVELPLGKEAHFPTYIVPENTSQKEYLIALIAKGIGQRYNGVDIHNPRDADDKKIVDRVFHELAVIERTGFINYFLVVWDFVQFAKDHHIPVGPGRGSGAGSIVAYALGITGIDPLHYSLIFERFLNPERVSPPDFDIDFCQTRRGEVIEYVKDKYGRENVAQIITFGTLGAKTVIRDVGRVLEIPFGDCDELAKKIPEEPGMTLSKAMEDNPEFREAVQSDPNAMRIMKYARVLEGLPRNAGTHAAGVVIGEKPLDEILPLGRDKDKETVTQFEMKPMEATGLLKMDFLGLKTLTYIQETIDHIKRTKGLDVDIDTIPLEDEKTYELLNRGDTVGVFQLESAGMRDLLRRISLSRIEDLIAMIALYRPGPMNWMESFIECKHGKREIQYQHPLLEEILKETYGIMLYQEQVQQAANVLAGFTMAQGDLLRRAMGKKDKDDMARQKEAFLNGCKEKNNIPEAKANEIFTSIEAFAGYGFNKSHSAAYGVISYQTAYLKAHFPVEFMAAFLSTEMRNADKLPGYIAEAQDMGIPVLPPSVNNSSLRFTPEKDSIRFGMAGIKNVGVGAVESITREREAQGDFEDLIDFCMRLDGSLVNRKTLESLIKCGAFDYTDMSRGRLFAGIDFAMGRAAATQKDQRSGQTSLFDMLDPAEQSSVSNELPEAPPWPATDMLTAEKELLGFYISGHPLMEFKWTLEHLATTSLSELNQLEPGSTVRVGGLVTGYAKKFTRTSQEAMGTFQLEGIEAKYDAVMFAGPFRDFSQVFEENRPVLVCGEYQKDANREQIIVNEIYKLDEAGRHFITKLSLHVPASSLDDKLLGNIQLLVKQHPGPIPLHICLEFPGGEKVFVKTDHSHKIMPSESFVDAIRDILGDEGVYPRIRKGVYLRESSGKPRFKKRNASAT